VTEVLLDGDRIGTLVDEQLHRVPEPVRCDRRRTPARVTAGPVAAPEFWLRSGVPRPL